MQRHCLHVVCMRHAARFAGGSLFRCTAAPHEHHFATFLPSRFARIVRITRIVKTVRLMRIFRFVLALRTLVYSIMHTLKALLPGGIYLVMHSFHGSLAPFFETDGILRWNIQGMQESISAVFMPLCHAPMPKASFRNQERPLPGSGL